MTETLSPIQVWGQSGPNPPKVALILEELKIPYNTVPLPLDHVKDAQYLEINPNGRLPAIIDPNTNITLWESGAIVEYIIDTYDTKRLISFKTGSPEYWHARQWLHFQATGQGPYYGQISWFQRYHPENVPSAIERYVKEANRVTGVLESWLAKQNAKFGDAGGGPWLVSDRKSYADLVFVPWQIILARAVTKEQLSEDDYPLVKEWMEKMKKTVGVQKVWEGAKRENAMKWEGWGKYPQT